MWRFPKLAQYIRTEGFAIAVETAEDLADGTYWDPSPDREPRGGFPVHHEPDVDFGGGD